MKKVIITESEKNRIKKLYGLINESATPIIDKNVTSSEIKKILSQIEAELNDTFTDQHFEDEKNWSGEEVTSLPGALLPEVQKAFDNLKQKCPTVTIKTNGGYRDLNGQKNQFLQYAKQNGGTITGGQKQAAIPGFSQHNSGKAIDITNYNSCPESAYTESGFVRPFFPDPVGPRIAEPWHLYFVDYIIKANTLKDLRVSISDKTKNQSLNLNSIKLNVDNKTFSVDKGLTQVTDMLLRYNIANESTCPSCEATKRENAGKILKTIDGKFENNTRMYSLIILGTPKKSFK